jgi:hypothetical protein
MNGEIMKDVFFYFETNEISFEHVKGESICVGETSGTLEDFIAHLKDGLEKRNVVDYKLPTIKQR